MRLITYALLIALPWCVATRAGAEPTSPSLAPSGDPTLAIGGALREARENSPELKRLQARAEGANWKKLESLSVYLPQVSVDGEHYLASRYSRLGVVFGGSAVDIPSAYPQTMLGITASITLFDGFGGWHTYRASRLEAEASRHELSYAEFALAQEVHLRFLEALAAQ